MPSLKVIRKRISSVKSTQQITRAMKMVAASKLRRAQDRIVAARPYAEKMDEMVGNLASRAGDKIQHPLLEVREVKKVYLAGFASDRGLCGSFNTNLLKTTERFIAEERAAGREVILTTVGRKSFDYFNKRKYEIKEKYLNVSSANDYDTAQVIARDVIKAYTQKECDRAVIIFSQFYSAAKQRPIVKDILPISTGTGEKEPSELLAEFIFEPPAEKLLAEILPRSVEVQVYRGVLDNLASEFGARMSAMESATTNAEDMIASLTLKYNRARQDAITKELMDIVGGAEAQAK